MTTGQTSTAFLSDQQRARVEAVKVSGQVLTTSNLFASGKVEDVLHVMRLSRFILTGFDSLLDDGGDGDDE